MKVYVVQSGTYDDSEILKITRDKDKACAFARNQGTEVDFEYGQEYDDNQIMRIRFKNQPMYDYVVHEYDLE